MKSKDSSLLYISFIQTPSLICPVPFLLSLLFPHWMTSPFLHVPFYIYASTLEHPTMFFNTEKSEPHSFASFLPVFLYYCSKLINFTVTQDQSKAITFFPIDSHQLCFLN